MGGRSWARSHHQFWSKFFNDIDVNRWRRNSKKKQVTKVSEQGSTHQTDTETLKGRKKNFRWQSALCFGGFYQKDKFCICSKACKKLGRHSSVNPSGPTILRPRVQIQSTISMLCDVKRMKIKNERDRNWPNFFKKVRGIFAHLK